MQRCSFLQWLIVPIILPVLAASICACSSSSDVCQTSEHGGYSYAEMNKKLEGSPATIQLTDGSEMTAENVSISGDSVYWGSTGGNGRTGMSSARVEKVTVKNHFVGALEGLGFGAAIGGGTGYLVGSSAGNGGEIPADAIGFVLGGAVGTLVGFTTGVIVGHRYHYEPCKSAQPHSLKK